MDDYDFEFAVLRRGAFEAATGRGGGFSWEALRTRILTVLERFPEARLAVSEAFDAL